MGISKYLLAAALSFCALGNLSAVGLDKHAKKHYLDEQSISVTDEGIIVEAKDGSLFRVKTLRSDKNGVYLFKSDCSLIEKWQIGNLFRRRCSCGKMFDSLKALKKHLKSGNCPDHPKK